MSRLALALALVACGSSPATKPGSVAPGREVQPPRAETHPHDVPSLYGARNDPYYWLRDDTRKDPKVLAYLRAENDYASGVFAPYNQLEDTLFHEMRARIKEDDQSVPTFQEGYWYYTRYETGNQYPIYCRRKGTMKAAEEVLIDANQLARGHEYYVVGTYAVSHDGKLLAWADDSVGRYQFALHIRNLATGEALADTATNIAPSLAWASDNKTLFYTGKDEVTLREDRVLRHVVGGKHELVYKEGNGSYYVSVQPSKSRRYIFIHLSATENSETRLIDADKPTEAPRVFIPRSKQHLYDIDHLGNRFVMRTNDGAKNFRLVEIAPGKENDRRAWKELVPHRADTLVEGFALYDTFFAVSLRNSGLRKVELFPSKGGPFYVDAQDAAYSMTLTDTPEPASTHVRYTYDAMQTPTQVYEVDVATKQRTLLKQEPVPTYDPSKYASEYLHATAKDGAQVPISVVYRKDTPRDGRAPLIVYGYGSYGDSMEPEFEQVRVSMLDRGWIYAIAHVRGGEEMGRAWYEHGRQLEKMNTFTDFIAATEYLVDHKYAARDQVFATGGSAGGLLMGAITNLRPDLYRGIAAIVPFVDVVTTMLDETVPLTSNEFDEWGDPKQKAFYDYMLAYSPYDNVTAKDYPSIYVRTGLWDSQVQYFEPAKWVAKLRATKTDRNLVVMDVDMHAGHGGPSGRFDAVRDEARAFTFMMLVHDRPDSRHAKH